MATPPLSDRLKAQIVKAVREHGSIKAAALALRLPRQTADARFRHAINDPRGLWPDPRTKKEKAVRPAPVPPTADERREILTLRAETSALKRQLREADEARIEADRYRSMSRELHDKPLAPPPWAVRVPAGSDSPGAPVLFLSDWHIGETVDPAQLHGANAFNEEIAERRVKATFDRALYLAFQHVKTPEYPGIVVVLGGDFVSGWLHEELFRSDWCAPTQAANWCISRLRRGLSRLADAFGKVWAVCVPGNHGRLTRYVMAKGGSTSCFDHLIYEALSDFLADDPRIQFAIPPSGDTIVQIGTTRYLVMHGHELGVKGGDGIIGSLGPIMRGTIKTSRAERSIGRDFDVILLAHFHQPLWLPRSGIIVNNALKGYDEYARKCRFAMTPASQMLFFSHHRFGPNMPFDIFVDDPPDRPAVPFAEISGAR